MINTDLTTLMVAIVVIIFFGNLGGRLTRWRESTFEKALIVIIMFLAGSITFVFVAAFCNRLISSLAS